VAKVGDYVDALREAHVYVDPGELRKRMVEALHAEAKKLGGVLVEDPFLVDECAGMVEEPFVVPGSFDPSFLSLPDGVIISVMRDHQRYFAVRDAGGKLMPRYLNVVNTANDPETIAHGNDRVLKARLDDAQFFVDEDRKSTLGDKVPKLDSVVWQSKLGSIGDKVRRLEVLAPFIAPDSLAKLTLEAARLCKADLVTLMVGEFPELQGEMGSFYVDDGELGTVIREHYLPRGASDDVPETDAGAALAVADRLDTLVGCFGIGLVPSGSADPFALRRAALGVIRIALEGPTEVPLPLRTLAQRAYQNYPEGALKPRDGVLDTLHDFFRARLKSHFSESHSTDLVEACLAAWDGESVRDVKRRIEAVATFRELPAFDSLAVAFKRAHNIAKDAPPGDVDESMLAEDAEKELHAAFSKLRPKIEDDIQKGEYVDALGAVARDLRAPIDRFFEEVFVMVDDDRVRDNRLRLLGGIDQTLTGIAHFHELST
jgi:glycyl-tRNA synthetase beta chain